MNILNVKSDPFDYAENAERLKKMIATELIKGTAPQLSDHDSILSEPLLYFNIYNPQIAYPLSQISLGYIKLDTDKEVKIEKVVTDPDNNIAYFPKWGYIENISQSEVTLKGGNVSSDKNIKFTPLKYIQNSEIEILQYMPPIYTIAVGKVEKVKVSRLLENYEALLQRAFLSIRQNNPVFNQLIDSTIKNISLFKSPDLNSFASMMMHGSIFLNVGIVPKISEVLFIEDIAHQAAHVIFNVITIDTEDFLVVDKNTKASDSYNSGRTVYVVYHALFTYCCILDCLDQYLENKTFLYEEDMQEAIIRIGFLLRKMEKDIETTTKEDYYTESGKSLLSEMLSSYDEMLNKYKDKIAGFNYSQQPYNFDIKKFLEINTL